MSVSSNEHNYMEAINKDSTHDVGLPYLTIKQKPRSDFFVREYCYSLQTLLLGVRWSIPHTKERATGH